MGLLSFLNPDKPTYPDKVWKTRPVAIKGMITDALVRIKSNEVPLVFCYFEDTTKEVISFLTSAGVPHFYLSSETINAAAEQSNVVFVGDASLILSSDSLMRFMLSVKNKIHFLFKGHYPLPTKEREFTERLAKSHPQSVITFYSSIDDPAFEPFGAERINAVLDTMGLKPDECIEHTLVTKSMARARAKIESMVSSEIKTKSESEWFVKNVKK